MLTVVGYTMQAADPSGQIGDYPAVLGSVAAVAMERDLAGLVGRYLEAPGEYVPPWSVQSAMKPIAVLCREGPQLPWPQRQGAVLGAELPLGIHNGYRSADWRLMALCIADMSMGLLVPLTFSLLHCNALE